MTDRELLASAAKAAGIRVYFDDVGQCCKHYPRDPMATWLWNPLADDGDALRLAVKLGIHISQQLSYCATFFPHGDNCTRGMTWTEQYNADPATATRRAIVRAAGAMVAGRAVGAA